MKVVQCYPRFFYVEEGKHVANLMSLNEIKNVLEGFYKARSTGPNGWIVDFFLEFFDMVGPKLLDMAEESKIQGKFYGALNVTFIALIPKCDKPKYDNFFWLISLCNLVYKIITEVIANRIKPMLSKFMSKEQFWFLDN